MLSCQFTYMIRPRHRENRKYGFCFFRTWKTRGICCSTERDIGKIFFTVLTCKTCKVSKLFSLASLSIDILLFECNCASNLFGDLKKTDMKKSLTEVLKKI